MRIRWTVASSAALALAGVAGHACANPPARGFDVTHYAATLQLDIAAGTLQAEQTIMLTLRPGQREVLLDRGELVLDAISEGAVPLRYDTPSRQLRIRLPAGPARRELTLRYHGKPSGGLLFRPARNEAYTIFSASQWLISVDAPDERATLDLTVVVPTGLSVVANGSPVSQRKHAAGLRAHRWRLRRPTPGFLYGFAAGPYRRSVIPGGRTQLETYSVTHTGPEQRRIFSETGAMLAFFAERAGVAYPDRAYRQVLVADTVGQELAGLAFLSEAHGAAVLEAPGDTALIAHELAHQWWGSLLTCRSWSHFWLNEGFATFMSAAWLEHRDGRDAYLQRVDAWRERMRRLQRDGNDHALVYASWQRPTAADRAVVYQKGAYVLHLLRELLGEQAFWSGIRAYTQAHAGQSVTTSDLRSAMERASGGDLGAFFTRWAGPETLP